MGEVSGEDVLYARSLVAVFGIFVDMFDRDIPASIKFVALDQTYYLLRPMKY